MYDFRVRYMEGSGDVFPKTRRSGWSADRSKTGTHKEGSG